MNLKWNWIPNFLIQSFSYARALEPMARVPKMARGKIPLARGIRYSPYFYILFFVRPVCLYCEEHVYIYIYLIAQKLYMYYRCYQIICYCEWNTFTQIGSGAKCWVDIYRWGAGLAVSWPIRDIGQNVLQSYFETASSSSHTYCHIFFPLWEFY